MVNFLIGSLESATCPLTLPRDPLQFKELHLFESPTSPFSIRLLPFTAWTIWFSQTESSYVNFQFYGPLNTRLALLANKNEPPTLTTHQIFQVISEDSQSESPLSRIKRDSQVWAQNQWFLVMINLFCSVWQLVHLKSVLYFEPGSWYVTVVNDIDQISSLVVNISTIHNITTQCPNKCHNHGFCHLGKCQCFPGFIGVDCADSKCANCAGDSSPHCSAGH